MTSRASASVAMALDDLRQLFEGAKRSVFRLETLPVYEVGEDIERQRAFAAEGRLPPPSPDRVAFHPADAGADQARGMVARPRR
jgi:hypothetical protein